jgi:hypothetical protein
MPPPGTMRPYGTSLERGPRGTDSNSTLSQQFKQSPCHVERVQAGRHGGKIREIETISSLGRRERERRASCSPSSTLAHAFQACLKLRLRGIEGCRVPRLAHVVWPREDTVQGQLFGGATIPLDASDCPFPAKDV